VAALALLLTLALAATLRLALGEGVAGRWWSASPVVRVVTHPAWLVPLLLVFNLTVGMYFAGTLSPWPPAAFRGYAATSGFWTGSCAFLATLTTDLWLLWVPASVPPRLTGVERRDRLRRYRILNVLAGAVVLALASRR
jgi:hypothetical protein